MKLKTLKDMDTGHKAEITDGKGKIIDRPISSLDLKIEAIKWYKTWENDNGIGSVAILEFIKHFFNLTNKDLEEK